MSNWLEIDSGATLTPMPSGTEGKPLTNMLSGTEADVTQQRYSMNDEDYIAWDIVKAENPGMQVDILGKDAQGRIVVSVFPTPAAMAMLAGSTGTLTWDEWNAQAAAQNAQVNAFIAQQSLAPAPLTSQAKKQVTSQVPSGEAKTDWSKWVLPGLAVAVLGIVLLIKRK
jgi:hypothetical protein